MHSTVKYAALSLTVL